MLVLSRKPGESLLIGSDIVVTVVSLGNGRVKLGVMAPAQVEVDREEIAQRKLETGQNLANAQRYQSPVPVSR